MPRDERPRAANGRSGASAKGLSGAMLPKQASPVSTQWASSGRSVGAQWIRSVEPAIGPCGWRRKKKRDSQSELRRYLGGCTIWGGCRGVCQGRLVPPVLVVYLGRQPRHDVRVVGFQTRQMLETWESSAGKWERENDRKSQTQGKHRPACSFAAW